MHGKPQLLIWLAKLTSHISILGLLLLRLFAQLFSAFGLQSDTDTAARRALVPRITHHLFEETRGLSRTEP